MSTTTTPRETEAEALAERIFDACNATYDLFALYMGDRLGWYRALAEHGPLTSLELAEHTHTDERYAREWLEHQAVGGVLRVVDASAPATQRRFFLSEAHAEVLTDELSLDHVLPFARFVASRGRHLDDLAHAYRTGTGLAWADLGADAREAQGAGNKPMFLKQLGDEWLPQVPDVHARLQRPGARIADVGCGEGWSAIGLARTYPDAVVDGYDVDGPSIEAARRHAAAHGLGDRVRFHLVDAGDVVGDDVAYDAVFAFEVVHDLADPVSVLAAMRRMAEPDGAVVVMDERVAETFEAPGGDVERFMYGHSLFCCLADCRAHGPSVATGTVMRPSTLRSYAVAAGLERFEVLPIEHDFFRFYRLA